MYTYIPPEPKDWVSLGSEKEIKEESVTENRRRVSVVHVKGRSVHQCRETKVKTRTVFFFKFKLCHYNNI